MCILKASVGTLLKPRERIMLTANDAKKLIDEHGLANICHADLGFFVDGSHIYCNPNMARLQSMITKQLQSMQLTFTS